MKIIRDYWKKLIVQTRDKAFNLLREEEEICKNIQDAESLLEIELVKKEIDNVILTLNLDQFKTPITLLRYWPSILTPGPSLLTPWRLDALG